MKEKTITSKEAIAIITMFLFGSAVIMGGNGPAKQDSWIAIILAMVVSIPIYFVSARIITLHPGKDLFDIAIELFGNTVGKAIVFLLTFYSFLLGAFIYRSFADFMMTASMPETPELPFLILIGLVSVYAVKSGFQTLGKTSALLLFLMLILVFLTTLMAAKDMKIENLFPIGGQGVATIMGNSYVLFILPFSEVMIFTCVASCLGQKENPYKIYFGTLLLAGITFLVAVLRNIMVIGFPILGQLYYPSFTVMRIVSIGDFLERIEITISSIFIIAGFVKVSLCMFAASKGLTKLFDFDDYRQMVFPTFLTTIALTSIVYNNVMELYEDINVYKYYAFPILVFLPIVILIAAEIKNRKKTKINN